MQARLALCFYFTYYFITLLQEGRGDAGGSVIVRADVDEGAPFALFTTLLQLLFFTSRCALLCGFVEVLLLGVRAWMQARCPLYYFTAAAFGSALL